MLATAFVGNGQFKQNRLKQTRLFANLNRKELEALAEATTEVTVADGTVIACEGHSGHEAFVILEGTVDFSIDGQKVGTAGPNELVGELSLLLHEPRRASVTATSELRILVIEHGHFDDLLERVPSMARSLLASLAQRLRDTDALLHH